MFQIIIKEITEVSTTDRGYELISETGNKQDDGKVWGYVPYETTKTVETIILEQTLKEMDIPAVIKAVNQL